MIYYKPEHISTFKKIHDTFFAEDFEEQLKIYKDSDILQIYNNRVDKVIFFYSLKENYWKHL